MRTRDLLEVASSADLPTFEDRLVRFAEHLDFGIVTAALAIDRPNRPAYFRMIGNTPAAFQSQARDTRNFRRDPVLQTLRQTALPCIYDQKLYASAGAGDLWDAMAPYGYRTGVAMAMHLDSGRHFLFGVDRIDPLPEDETQLTRLVADLQLLAIFAQETAARILAPEPENHFPAAMLSRRELDVLQWVRDGKSNWMIGQLMSISEHTVDHHLRQAMRKLNTSSRHVAALRALELKLIM